MLFRKCMVKGGIQEQHTTVELTLLMCLYICKWTEFSICNISVDQSKLDIFLLFNAIETI